VPTRLSLVVGDPSLSLPHHFGHHCGHCEDRRDLDEGGYLGEAGQPLMADILL
jgi:hypothetical protein